MVIRLVVKECQWHKKVQQELPMEAESTVRAVNTVRKEITVGETNKTRNYSGNKEYIERRKDKAICAKNVNKLTRQEGHIIGVEVESSVKAESTVKAENQVGAENTVGATNVNREYSGNRECNKKSEKLSKDQKQKL